MPHFDTENQHYLNHRKGSFCIHEPDFTNAIFTNEVEPFMFALSQVEYKNWEEITKSSHFRPIEDDNEKVRIKKYLHLRRNQFNNLKIEPAVCQIPIGEKEEFRAIIIFKKKLLFLLFFDPNHHFCPNFPKIKLPRPQNGGVCLMRKENCGQFYECKFLSEREWRRLISERNKKKRK